VLRCLGGNAYSALSIGWHIIAEIYFLVESYWLITQGYSDSIIVEFMVAM
jgi:hypothetical protein